MAKKVILASGSPRRKELLEQVGVEFEQRVSGKEERYTATEPKEIVKELALMKAENVASDIEAEKGLLIDTVVIGADTIVVLDGQILGKPRNEEHAFEMLQNLQGRSHEVYTGVAFLSYNKEGKKDFLQLLKENNYTVENLLYDKDCSKNIIIDINSDLYESFLYGLESLKNIIEYPLTRVDKLILFIGDTLLIEKEERAIVDYLGFYVKYLQSENNNINLQQIYNLLSDRKNRVFSYIIEIVSEINGYEPYPGSITVCNYHKSKGLEWDCVFLLGMTEFNFPDNIYQKFQCDKWYLKEKYKNPQANIKAEIDLMLQGEVTKNYPKEIKENLIKEKIRLLYVGITRAKEMLILSASAKNSAQDKRNQNPSMYLNILKNIN